MISFAHSLGHWPGDAFGAALKRDLEALTPAHLPLSGTPGAHPDDQPIAFLLLSAREDHGAVYARVGVFYSETSPACACGDDPVSENAYCVLHVRIDRNTACASFSPADDEAA